LGAVAFWGRFEAAYLVFVVGASVDWCVLVYGLLLDTINGVVCPF
jgi:hypothetical protein